MSSFRKPLLAFLAVLVPAFATADSANPSFTMEQVLHYSYVNDLTAAEHADRIGWVRNVAGVRNVWVAQGPAFQPRQVTRNTEDDGQEITQLTFSPDGTRLVYVRGGDHDANWPAEGKLAPDPASSSEQPLVTIWSVPARGGAPAKITEGDAPAISSKGALAYIKDDQVWTAPLDGRGKPARMLFDRGKDSDLHWSPDGKSLAFVSDRGDHAFIGIFLSKDKPLEYLLPSTDRDLSPRWSPDGTKIAFLRQQGDGGPPDPILKRIAHPWSIWVANAADGTGHIVWQSPDTLAGSYPEVEGGANLNWGEDDRLVFLACLDDWPHLYSVKLTGGAPLLLTTGREMIEHVVMSRDLRFVIVDANAGRTPDDSERRHIFRISVSIRWPAELTGGQTVEWTPVAASDTQVAFVTAGAKEPATVGMVGLNLTNRHTLDTDPLPKDFPVEGMVVPKAVTFKAADGLTVHGQLFQRAETGPAKAKPGIIFVHGGPPRQMMLGWHYMDYYSNAYAVNQYLAAHGFVVLSVNYRLGIGYGRAYQQPDHWGPTGAAEYQDVVAGAQYLQHVPGVDAKRIGIWGGSYGGYLTALALARNSDIFKAGVDIHGVHDWSNLPDFFFSKTVTRFEKGDLDEAKRVAWASSPDSSIDSWKSPVLLIQGDDDRNVPFHQTVDLARRLEARHLPFEEFVIPNEIHGFLRHDSWARVDNATVGFLARKLGAPAN